MIPIKRIQWILFVCTLLPLFLNAQESKVIKQFEIKVNGSFDFKEGLFKLSLPSTIIGNNTILLVNASLLNGDLRINYKITSFRKGEDLLSLCVYPKLITSLGKVVTPHSKQIEGRLRHSYSSKPQKNEIIWRDFQEDYQEQDQQFSFTLTGKLEGPSPIDCKILPDTFNLKNKLPHIVMGGAGLGLVISGLLTQSSSDSNYEQYTREIFAGEPSNNSYNKANNQNKTAGILKLSGYSILGLNAITYAVRYFKFKRNQENYDYYCKEKRSNFQPVIGTNGAYSSVGFQLIHNF